SRDIRQPASPGRSPRGGGHLTSARRASDGGGGGTARCQSRPKRALRPIVAPAIAPTALLLGRRTTDRHAFDQPLCPLRNGQPEPKQRGGPTARERVGRSLRRGGRKIAPPPAVRSATVLTFIIVPRPQHGRPRRLRVAPTRRSVGTPHPHLMGVC